MSEGAGRTARWVGVAVAASVLLPGGTAGATPESEDGSGSYTSLGAASGVCGWWSAASDLEWMTVVVCGFDGFTLSGDGTSGTPEQRVAVSRYVCSRFGGECEGEEFDAAVERGALRIDPLLRRASIRTGLGPCTVDVEFAPAGAAQPGGAVHESHGGFPGAITVGAGQGVTRPASWWGHVCGQVVDQQGEGEMWSRAGGVLARPLDPRQLR